MTELDRRERIMGARSRRGASRPAALGGAAAGLVALWLAAPAPLLGAGIQPFDHAHPQWTDILARYVTAGVVDYAGLKRDAEPALGTYLGALEAGAASVKSWTREEKLAFWINAYNAYTIRLILDHQPVRSIRSIGFLPGSAFRRNFIPLGPSGRKISLDDIEHRTLRPDFNDARIHFAIVCASVGCPELRAEAYRAGDVDRQLDDAAREFLADRDRNRYDGVTNTLHLSSIFDWFRADFERDAGSIEAYAARYLPWPDAEAVLARRPAVRFLEYDWSLNGR